MRPIIALLILCCIVSLSPGQYVETTILLPDSTSGLASVGSLVFHSPTNTIYVGGSDSFLVAINALTNAKLRRMVVGDGPHVLSSDPLGNKVYCANGEATVTVIDGATNQPAKTIPVGQVVTDLVYNEQEDKLYCGNTTDSVVRVIDCGGDSVVARVRVGSGPGALCYNPQLNRIYCAERDQDEVTVIDCAADTVLTTVWVRGVEPVDICFDSAMHLVCTANRGSSTVSVIDCSGDTLLRVVSVGRGAGAIVTGLPGKVYCSNYGDNSLSVITESGVKMVRTVQYPGALSYDPVNQKVYCCAGQWYAGVTVLDAVGDTVVEQPEVADPTALCWNPAGNSTYVTSTSDDHVSVVGGVSDTVEAAITFVVANPGPLCYSTTDNRLYCLDQSNNLLYVVDGESNQVLKSIKTESHSDALLWSPASDKVYVGSSNDGTVSIIDCGSDSIVATLATGRDAYNMDCSDDGKVYVAVDSGVVVIDGEGDSVCSRVPIPTSNGYYPSTLCYDRTDQKMYVGTGYTADSAVVRAIDTRVDTVEAAIVVWRGLFTYQLGLCWVQGYDKLYVSCDNSDNIAVIDCVRDTILKRISVTAGVVLSYSDSATGKVYCYDGWNYFLRVIKAATDTLHKAMGVREVTAFVDNGKQGPANRLYCTDPDNGIVTVIMGYKTDSILRRISVGSSPSALAWNPTYSRIYVSNSGSSSISVIRDTFGVGLEEGQVQATSHKPQATVTRGVLNLGVDSRQQTGYRAELLDAAGRMVMRLKVGANDVRALAPGVYFVREAVSGERLAVRVRKVVVTR
jgi:YVTN family beta-propeller protein